MGYEYLSKVKETRSYVQFFIINGKLEGMKAIPVLAEGYAELKQQENVYP